MKKLLIRLAYRSAAGSIENNASILIIVLWSLCMLSAFAIILSYNVRQKIILVQRLDERSKLRLIAEAGVDKAVIVLNKKSLDSYDSLNSEWGNNIAVFKGGKVGDGQFDVVYDFVDEKTGLKEIRYGVVDEERKININKADQAVLRRFFEIVLHSDEMEAQELAASIVDWRDSDSQLSIPLGSAEDSDYRSSRYSYEAKDADFEVLEELLLVKGITLELFDRIKDYFTVYGDGKVNINTASKAVLLAVGIGENIVENISLYRNGDDGVFGTRDDRIFINATQIGTQLSGFIDMPSTELEKLSAIVEQNLDIVSNNFMIKSIATSNNGRNTTQVVCVVDRSGNIRFWHEL